MRDRIKRPATGDSHRCGAVGKSVYRGLQSCAQIGSEVHIHGDLNDLLVFAAAFRIVEVSGKIDWDSGLDLSVEEEIQSAKKVRFPSPIGPENRRDVVQSGDADALKRPEV